MANDRIGRCLRDTHVRTGSIAEQSRGAGSINCRWGEGTVAEGERVEGGACKGIVGVAESTTAGVATAGGLRCALKADVGMLRADQSVGADKGLIRVGGAAAEAELVRSLVDAGHTIALALVAVTPHQAKLKAQCCHNCKLYRKQ